MSVVCWQTSLWPREPVQIIERKGTVAKQDYDKSIILRLKLISTRLGLGLGSVRDGRILLDVR